MSRDIKHHLRYLFLGTSDSKKPTWGTFPVGLLAKLWEGLSLAVVASLCGADPVPVGRRHRPIAGGYATAGTGEGWGAL